MPRSGSPSHRARSAPIARTVLLALVIALVGVDMTGAATSSNPRMLAVATLDGAGNNRANPTWGMVGTPYVRVGRPSYADGIAAMVARPNARYISNRIFNDTGQNFFSENNISQWGWVWGQFLDHDMGLRDERPAEDATIPFDSSDPLESFTNDLGGLSFARTPAARATGLRSPRQQVNTLSSYINASNVYGVTRVRLDWLREGSVDGNPTNNGASLVLPDGYLPRADARGDVASAPTMNLMGRLMGQPGTARVAGDVRANENLGLTAIQTLFAREHNRIVASLPSSLPPEAKFQLARRIVAAEIQYITYNEFLPALGVRLPPYRGYNANLNAGVTNEFAVVGFRAHSMVHGEFEIDFDDEYSAEQLTAFSAAGIAVDLDEQSMAIPLSVAFGNPDLVQQVGLGPILEGLGGERQYRNDEQIDNAMRSILFEVPRPGTTDPAACQTPVVDPRCFSGVADLAAADIQRGRDHGMPSYNDMRSAYGLPRARSFTAITGESTDRFPADPAITAADPINDPDSLDFVELRDAAGAVIDPASPEAEGDAVSGVRRTTLAARLKAIYGTVDQVDAFVGMSAEHHLPGTEFGSLQLAIWRDQFLKERDGDRFFYQGDAALAAATRAFGVTYRHSLAEIIGMNAGVAVEPDVFRVPAPSGPEAP